LILTLIHEEADEIRFTIFFFTSFGEVKRIALVVTSNKLTNTFSGLVTSGLGPDVTREPPVGLRWLMPSECRIVSSKLVHGMNGWWVFDDVSSDLSAVLSSIDLCVCVCDCVNHELGKKRSWPTLKHYPSISLRQTSQNECLLMVA
jgi:hypothetical protein